LPDPALGFASEAVRQWFEAALGEPTRAQRAAWPAIARGESTLLLAPTGSGKTLAAFLVALSRVMFDPAPNAKKTRILYVSPLKALGVDVERNLRAPLSGIAQAAERLNAAYRLPSIGVRSGDTPPKERSRLLRHPPEILITTPESLYLMLTSNARETLNEVDTVIVDEIHAISGSKRGAHLSLSLERLAELRSGALQRIGLSATQRPLDEIAHFLGGAEFDRDSGQSTFRSVTIVDESGGKELDISIEVAVEDMATLARLPSSDEAPSRAEQQSIWPAIHPRLLQLVDAHRSTMIFANSRRLAERLALAVNELAGRPVALAHHGSLAKDQRQDIEERLKRGELPAIVATSSLELGIDMGAVDLVIQVEAPHSIASGLQRIGRAGHQVGAVSRGRVFPKFRGDLLACAAAVPRMKSSLVEETHYPRNPLDVLAQHIVAAVAVEPRAVEDLFALVRRAAPFAELKRESFDNVLDLLSGRYNVEPLNLMRPRLVWDRAQGLLETRRGARQIAILSGGTIPDRGLYPVYLSGTSPRLRLGELERKGIVDGAMGYGLRG
jgi:ATP-dependent Lhr-like helicase